MQELAGLTKEAPTMPPVPGKTPSTNNQSSDKPGYTKFDNEMKNTLTDWITDTITYSKDLLKAGAISADDAKALDQICRKVQSVIKIVK
jgi:hypothetical protein